MRAHSVNELLKTRKPYMDKDWTKVRAAFKAKLNELILSVLGPEWVVVYGGDYGPNFMQALVKVL